MIQQALTYFTDTHITVMGFGLFLVTFVGVVAWAMFFYKNEEISRFSNLPLKGEER